ncbi:MAG: transglutaminase-like domain-containing protein, partial [Planctomycetaceae bacterium]|nr:transglutaminase-like domain-containing protein [Planctomycetaceae bacterium]
MIIYLILFPFIVGCSWFEPIISSVTGVRVDAVAGVDILQNGGEYWETITVDGNQIGFQRTALSRLEDKLLFEQQSRLIALRHGERFDVAMLIKSESDSNGMMTNCKLQITTGRNPIETNFSIKNNKLVITTEKNQQEIEWQKTAGADAIIRSLLANPLKLSEKRQITFFDPSQSRIVKSMMTAESIEQIPINGDVKNLLRINVQNQINHDSQQEYIYWTDRGGNIIRTETVLDKKVITTSRSPKKLAISIISDEPNVDLGNFGEVILDGQIELPRTESPISYQVKFTPHLPKGTFTNSAFQKIVPLDDSSVQITVWSAVGNIPKNYGNTEFDGTNDEPQSDDQFEEYLVSNGFIDLDDPVLLQLAAAVDSSKMTDWETAVMLEKLVSKTVKLSSLSVAFASSADALQLQKGDCTEQAVLLAALCRVKKIPSRVVLGLAFSVAQNGTSQNQNNPANQNDNNLQNITHNKMVFHLWNEVYVDGIWCPLDAAYALGGADAARIK